MRKIIIALLLCNTAFAQLPIDSTSHLITYTGVVQANGTQQELYSRAREWFAKTYNSAQSVIQMDDKDKIVGKALMKAYYKKYRFGYINYTVTIYIKDDKYKYEFTEFYHKGEYVGGGVYIGNTYISNADIPNLGPIEGLMDSQKKRDQKIFAAFSVQINDNVKSLIASLEETMNKQAAIKDF
jgi:hypothetical protein